MAFRGLAAFVVTLGITLHMPAGAVPVAEPPPAAEAEVEHEAATLWRRGYLLHELGHFEMAIRYFRESIARRPTAEAHTFLGWSLSHLGRLEEAIDECKTAIGIDPGFGNPYNDIGVYLMALDREGEAIPWFEKAIESTRYCCYQFAHYNKGRVLLGQGRVEAAKRSFERALEHEPNYAPARAALDQIEREYGQPL